MLHISSPQFRHLAGGVRARATSRMIAHVQRHFPLRAKLVGEEAVKRTVERCFAQADGLGLVSERDLMSLLSLQLYFGDGVCNDRQCASFAAILQRRDVATPGARIARAWREGMVFYGQVAGEHGRHHAAAINRLAGRQLARIVADDSPLSSVQAQGLLAEIWPEKYRVLQETDPQSLAGLMGQVSALASRHGISQRGAARVLLLSSFVFGIGFGDDPMLEAMAGVLQAGPAMSGQTLAAADALLARITSTGA